MLFQTDSRDYEAGIGSMCGLVSPFNSELFELLTIAHSKRL